MSIRDLGKCVNVFDSTTGDCLSVLDYDDFLDKYVYIKCSLGEIELLKFVYNCLNNEHGLNVKIGYKR